MILSAGALWALLLLAGNPLPADEASDAAVAKFRKDYRRTATENARTAAVIELAKCRHVRVARILAALIPAETMPLRIAAARELGAFRGVDGVSALLKDALGDKRNAGDKARGVRVMILRSLGNLKAADAAAEVGRRIADKDVWIAKAAVDAAGNIREKSLVDPLIEALRRVEGSAGKLLISADPLAAILPGISITQIIQGSLDGRAREKEKTEREILQDPIRSALRKITRVDHYTSAGWKKWWSKNKPTFKVPE